MTELFTQFHLDEMRKAYATLEAIDPCGPAYRSLIRNLNAMPQPVLKQLAEANIKFVSGLARNRVRRA